MARLVWSHESWRQKDVRLFLMALFLFALLIRLAAILIIGNPASPYHYSEHVSIARNVLEGRGFTFSWYGLDDSGRPTSFMPPLYIAVVLTANILFPSTPWLAIQILQAVLSASMVVLAYFIGRRLFGSLVGFLAALILAVYPSSVAYVIDIQTQTIERFLVFALVCSIIIFGEKQSKPRAIGIGLVLGILALSRPTIMLLPPLLLLWMLLSYGRRAIVFFAVVVCGLAV
ncbi:MAG: glycosyltransferase family 39 protein, partial [Dehalococcoidia bacterium]|nr:glycosyltransferase family 39 protein [Dehalococcoidia bacterium]